MTQTNLHRTFLPGKVRQALNPSSAFPALILAALLVVNTPVKAGYLIDPSGGTVIFNDSTDIDDNTINVPVGFSASFYGTAFTSVDVSTNGNLNFSASNSWTNSAFPNSLAMIAPLWDDHFIYQGSGQNIVESASAPNYFAVTWNVSQYNNTFPKFQFQVVLFGAATSISGFDFQEGDIAFAYQYIDPVFRNGDATVGLNSGNNSFATIPGLTDGIITDSQAGLLPTGSGQFALFRYDPQSGNYNSSIETVPEPAALASLATGLISIGFYRQRRRQSR